MPNAARTTTTPFSSTPDSTNGFNIKNYGATGDGTSDDTTAIQAAITAAGAGTTYAPPGTYILKTTSTNTAALTMATDKSRLVGSAGAIFKADAASSNGIMLVSVSGADVTVDGITFDPNSITDGTCVWIDAAARTRVQHNLFISPKSGGVHIAGAATDIAICNNTFNGAGYGILTAATSTPTRLLIADNVMVGGASGDGIELNIPTGGASDVVIRGNIISGYTSVGPNDGFGIGVSGASRVSITGNLVTTCGRNGIHLESGAASVGVTISGNVVSDCQQGGIEVQGESGAVCEDVVIDGNVVRGCCITPLYDLGKGGIDCGSGAANAGVKGLIVTNNTVVGTVGAGAAGIRAIECRNSIISNNTCKNTLLGPGMYLTSIHEGNVTGNRCYDDQTPKTQTYGITINSAGAWLLANNNLRGNLTAALSDTSPGLGTIRSNLGVNPYGNRFAPAFPATTATATNATPYDVTAYIVNGTSALTVAVDAFTLMVIPASAAAAVRIPSLSTFTPTYGGGTPTWTWWGE